MVRTAKLTTPLFGLRREIDRLFEDSFGNVDAPSFMTSGWMPLVDVKETDGELLFNLELPGVAEDKLDITCEGSVLTVSGEKETLKKDEEGKFHIVERPSGCPPVVPAADNVQEDKIEATVKDGVLTVKVQKMELPKPKKIEVKAIKAEQPRLAVGGGQSAVGCQPPTADCRLPPPTTHRQRLPRQFHRAADSRLDAVAAADHREAIADDAHLDRAPADADAGERELLEAARERIDDHAVLVRPHTGHVLQDEVGDHECW